MNEIRNEDIAEMAFHDLQKRISDWDITINCTQARDQFPGEVRICVLLEKADEEPITITFAVDRRKIGGDRSGEVFTDIVAVNIHKKYLEKIRDRRATERIDNAPIVYSEGFSDCLELCFPITQED